MKNYFYPVLTVVLLLNNFYLIAQSRPNNPTCNVIEETYSTTAGWTQINTGLSISDGKVSANEAGAYFIPRRIYKLLSQPVTFNDNWTIKTEFKDFSPLAD